MLQVVLTNISQRHGENEFKKVRKPSMALESKIDVCTGFEPGEQWFIFKSSDSKI